MADYQAPLLWLANGARWFLAPFNFPRQDLSAPPPPGTDTLGFYDLESLTGTIDDETGAPLELEFREAAQTVTHPSMLRGPWRLGPPVSPSLLAVTPGSPTNARLAQEHVEVLLRPTSANARLAQEHVEVLVKPTSANARIAQIHVEVLQSVSKETYQVVWGE